MRESDFISLHEIWHMKNNPMNALSNRIIFILSLIGIAVAVYVLQSFIRQASIVCVTTGCEVVRKSSVSYPFGIPVPAFGLVGYTLLALFAFLRTTTRETRNAKFFLHGMLGISIFGVLFVSWFTYMEIFVIRGVCTWCAISAVNMIAIFMLVLRSYLHQRDTI